MLPAKKAKFVGPMDMHYVRMQAGNCDEAHAQLQFENPTVPARFFSSASFKAYVKKIRLSSPSWVVPDRQKVYGVILARSWSSSSPRTTRSTPSEGRETGCP